MLQRLLIALTQVKAGNTFENLLNEICHIINYFYQAKESIQQYNEFTRDIIQNGYYIYKLKK